MLTQRGFNFDDPLSLDRQAYLCTLLREEAGLPSPKIHAVVQRDDLALMLMERMPGVTWRNFLENTSFSEGAYLASLGGLGEAVAKAQKVTFGSYGNVMPGRVIEPVRIENFADRIAFVNQKRIVREAETGSLTEAELAEVEAYFTSTLLDLRPSLGSEGMAPVLVMTDLHPMQFYVDEAGKPSGFFDNEFFQAAHPVLEIFNLRLQFFNYFLDYDVRRAEAAFFESYARAGGQYSPDDERNQKLDDLLAVGNMLVASTVYHGVVDGLRDTWSERYGRLTLRAVREGVVDRCGYQEIIREKTKQPLLPS